MVTLRKFRKKGYILDCHFWKVAVTNSEMKAIYLLLCRHYAKRNKTN
jgi:hypothetical protein